MLKNVRLKTQFLFSLLITFSITVALVVFVVDRINFLSELNRSIYKHPFVVSNAVRDAKNNITSMHAHMKDVALSETDWEMESAMEYVLVDEQSVFKNLDVIRGHFLGSDNLIEAVVWEIYDWKAAREAVFDLMRGGHHEAASSIKKSQGALHVGRIEGRMNALLEFANNKASAFAVQSAQAASEVYRTTVIALLVFLLASTLVLFLMYRNLIQQLLMVNKAAQDIEHGQYDVPVPDLGDNEIGSLARSFESMRLSIGQSIAENEQARFQAESANAEKTRFLANMSHELRTPMHAISAFTSLALKKSSDEKVRQHLGRVESASERLTGLVDNLLDLSKLESGNSKLVLREQEFKRVVENVVHELLVPLGERALDVRLDLEFSGTAVFDLVLISRVVRHLVSNAIRYSPPGTVIEVSLVREPDASTPIGHDALRLTVSDQGIGIPADELESVFGRFVQSSKTSSVASGTGLGLPICRRIVDRHGGTIWAESPPRSKRRGTAFHMLLPVRPVPAAVPVSKAAADG